jgi:hypothetical protein
MNDDIRPLKDVVDISGGFPIAQVLIIILAVLAVAAFVYFRKKKEEKQKSCLPPKPAEIIAGEALNALREMRLIEKGLIKEYYIRLSDIIRTYIGNRYGIFAMDKTTWELFQEMKLKRIERRHVDKINNFLKDCDMVKFAKYVPIQKEIEEIYKSAEEIIDMTTPKITL